MNQKPDNNTPNYDQFDTGDIFVALINRVRQQLSRLED